MAFGVTAFKSNLYNSTNGGGARPSLFEVDIAANTGNDDFSITDNLLVKAAAIPGRTINPVTVNWFGRAYKFTGNSTYDIWTVSIMNDEDFSQRSKILEWMRTNSGKKFIGHLESVFRNCCAKAGCGRLHGLLCRFIITCCSKIF